MRYHWGLGVGHMHAHRTAIADVPDIAGSDEEDDAEEDMDADLDGEDPDDPSGMSVPDTEDDWDEGGDDEDDSMGLESEEEYVGI